jgi:hypothetical protein
MSRVYLRGHTNIRKRLLIHTAGFNLGLLIRQRSAWARREDCKGSASRFHRAASPVSLNREFAAP